MDLTEQMLSQRVGILEKQYTSLEDRLNSLDSKVTWGFLAVIVLQIITKVVT
jgi:hypothetical protein